MKSKALQRLTRIPLDPGTTDELGQHIKSDLITGYTVDDTDWDHK